MSKIYDTITQNLEHTDQIQALSAAISDEVNNLFFPCETIVEELLNDDVARKRFLHIALQWIRSRAEDFNHGFYDGRDEASAKISSELLNSCYIQKKLKYEGASAEFAKRLVYGSRKTGFGDDLVLCRMHRTLKQTFSSLVFCFLNCLETGNADLEAILEQMRDRYGKHWYQCPFI